MVATLTGTLGAEHLELAEEVVQDAMLKALQVWSIRGVPDDPAAWLFQVARNHAIDRLRRAKTLGFSLDDIRELLALSEEDDIAEVKRAAQHKLEDIDRRIIELQRIRAGLHTLVDACPGHGRAEACPILNACSQD